MPILIGLSACLAALAFTTSVKQRGRRLVLIGASLGSLAAALLPVAQQLSILAKLPPPITAPAQAPARIPPPVTAPAQAPARIPPPVATSPIQPPTEGKIIAPGGGLGGTPGGGPGGAADAADRMKALQNAVEALPKGNIALRAPTKMTVGDQNEVKATVGFNVPMEALRKQLGLGPTDQKIEGSLSLSPDMAATLHGPGFTIEPTTPEQQSIAEGFPTVWSWNVTAKQEGEQELEATLYVIVGDGDKTTRIRVESFSQKINVSVRAQTWGEWLKSLADELGAVNSILVAIGAIVTLILGWLGFNKISPHKKKPRK